MNNNNQTCSLCAAPANLMCQRCYESYCSTSCQIKDWNQHKLICIPMPQLISNNRINNVTTLSKSPQKQRNKEILEDANIKLTIPKDFNACRRPNHNLTDDNLNNSMTNLNISNNLNEPNDNNNSINKQSLPITRSDEQMCNPNNFKRTVKNVQQFKNNHSFPPSEHFKNESNPINFTLKPISKPWMEVFPFPQDGTNFFNVLVQYTDYKSEIIWVTEQSLEPNLAKLLADININIGNADNAKITDIYVDNLLAAPFTDGLYYRAKVLNEQLNGKVNLRLIDYGNDFSVDFNKLKLLKPDVKDVNAFAFCCRYNKQIEIGEIINIRIAGKEDDNIFKIDQKIISQSNKKLSVLPSLGNAFNLMIMKIYDNSSKGLAVVINKSTIIELKKLNEILVGYETFKYDLTGKPTNGDLIAARTETGEWKRAIILDQCCTQFLIFFIDFCKIEFVEKIKILPNTFLNIPPQTILIDFNNIFIDKNKLMNLVMLSGRKTKELMNELMFDCDLYEDNNKIAEITINHFNGNLVKVNNLKFWRNLLLNGDVVRITKVINNSEIYITSNKLDKFYTKTFDRIGKSDDTKFNNNPEIGEMILAINNKVNNLYLRCRVLEKLNENTFKVQNLDTGDEFNADSDKIKNVNTLIKFAPILATRCCLLYLNAISINVKNNQALKTINSYCLENKTFLLKRDENCQNNIELFFNDNEKLSMNKHLIPLMFVPVEPINQSTLKNFFDLNDIDFKPIQIGEHISIIILDNSFIQKGHLTASMRDLEFLEKYFSEYQPKMNEFCNNANSPPDYEPRVGELCLLINEEDQQWYRAVCIAVSKNQFNLKFLDFGNTKIVNKSKIRKFSKEFQYPCIANKCSINGLPEVISQHIIDKLSEIFAPNNAITVDKIEYVKDVYSITIKGIKELF